MRALTLCLTLALAALTAGCENSRRLRQFESPSPAPRSERPEPLMSAPTAQVDTQALPPPRP